MNHRHIAIAGLPRSGSTLLYCLLRYVAGQRGAPNPAGWEFFDREERAFNKMPTKDDMVSRTVCTKKPGDADTFRVIESRARDNDVALKWIITVRDPRDVLVSQHAEGKPGYSISWDTHAAGGVGVKYRLQSILDLINNARYPVRIIKYETLVAVPDIVQEMYFPETMINGRRFSDYALKEPVEEPWYHSVRMHGPRPVDVNSIGQWKGFRGRVADQLGQCPEISIMANALGYAIPNEVTWPNPEENEHAGGIEH